MSSFGLDFDGTYTEDPELWDAFVTLAKQRGHQVTFVTSRDDNCMASVHEAATKLGIEALACNGLPKIKTADDNGLLVNIWIDDMPGMLFTQAEY